MVSYSGNNNDESDGISAPIETFVDGPGDDPPTTGCSIDTGVAPDIDQSPKGDTGVDATSSTSIATTTATATATATTTTDDVPPQEGLSKNRRKKLEKRERARQKNADRKAAEKAKRLATAIAQGRDIVAEKKFVEERTLSGDRRRRLDELWDSKKEAALAEQRFEICIDMGARLRGRSHSHKSCNDCSENESEREPRIRTVFEEAMREQEVASLAKQIRYCYSYNRKSPNPVLAAFTGMSRTRKHPTRDDDYVACGSTFPTVREILERDMGFPEWNRRMFDCTEHTLEEHYGLTTNPNENVRGNHPESPLEFESSPTLSVPQRTIVYLTSDSEKTLERLEENTVYVIGGIVDRNRLKRATIDRAEQELNVETAKLPLQEYLLANNISMTTTKVLTVNHVFDILLKYRQHGNNWDKAFQDVLPNRKV